MSEKRKLSGAALKSHLKRRLDDNKHLYTLTMYDVQDKLKYRLASKMFFAMLCVLSTWTYSTLFGDVGQKTGDWVLLIGYATMQAFLGNKLIYDALIKPRVIKTTNEHAGITSKFNPVKASPEDWAALQLVPPCDRTLMVATGKPDSRTLVRPALLNTQVAQEQLLRPISI